MKIAGVAPATKGGKFFGQEVIWYTKKMGLHIIMPQEIYFTLVLKS